MTKYLAPAPKFQALDASGAPISGGKVYTYESGASTVPLTTYTDASGGSSNTNPVVLDASGQANIWFTPGVLYRVVLKNSAETTTYYTIDNVAGSVTPSAYFATIMAGTSQTEVFDDVVAPGGTVTGSIIMSGAAVNEAASVTVASATSTPIGAAASNNVTVSGVATITSFDNVTAGRIRYVTFSGALTLTHNATSLILPGAANITTAAGDAAFMQSLGSGNWKCLVYQRADGTAVVSGSTAATQAQMETATSTTTMVTPGRTQYHPGVAKAWVIYNSVSQTVLASHNVTSVTYNGTGDFTINFTTAFSSANYAATVMVRPESSEAAGSTGRQGVVASQTAPTSSALRVITGPTNAVAPINLPWVSVVCFGDQA